MTIQIRRTPTPNNPPVGLLPGQLAVEMASQPPRLWCGVPYDINPSGRVLLGYAGGGSIFSTGDAKLTLKGVADPGWVMCDNTEVGPLGSNAEHEGDEFFALFVMLFNAIADPWARLWQFVPPETWNEVLRSDFTGAQQAWDSGCCVNLTKQLGRAIVIAGSGLGLTNRQLGAFFGEESHTPTVAEMIQHNHAASDPTHGHPGSASANQTRSAGYHYADQSDVHAYSPQWGGIDEYAWASAAGTGAGIANNGSSTAFNVMQASTCWNIMMKL